MGAMVTIKYAASIEVADIEALATGLKPLIEEAIAENDVFIYADTPTVAVGIEPIEVFIQVNGRKVTNPEHLTNVIAEKFSAWRQEKGFNQPINLNVIPVQWHSKIGL